MNKVPQNISNSLSSLKFKNSSKVNRDMRFFYHNMPCYYVEGIDKWTTPWGQGGASNYLYLYEIQEDVSHRIDPPSGMRSAVPLGGLGSGTIELRADGSLRDWNIFNNSPAGGGQKVHLDEAIFGLRTESEEDDVRAWCLRIHPPNFLPSISQIEYSGAFPVSRLRFFDNDLPLEVNLYAYCEFYIRDAERSSTPAVIFSFDLHNPEDKSIEASLMFNLPNFLGGSYSSDKGLTLSKKGNSPTSGTMALRIANQEEEVSCLVKHGLATLWREFADKGEFDTSEIKESEANHGVLCSSFNLKPGESKTVTFVLSWYFPYRPFGDEIVGNQYTNLYKNADEVADKVIERLPNILESIYQWQQNCFDNSLPEWLQDALINSVATMYKTGMWFEDGRWRQWESFSCSAAEPIHIHFYRSLPYAWFFPSLQKNLLKAFAKAQTDDGYIQEHLSRNRNPDNPGGRMMGDGCTTFILEAYQNYLWTGDKNFLDSIWKNIKKASKWQIRRCEKYGLPNNLNNTYDWWGFENKELVSYNAFLHLAAMLAAEKLAKILGDTDFAELCHGNFESSRKVLYEKFWTGEYFRSWWMDSQEYPPALHADTFYGQLWSFILGLGGTVESEKIKSHIDAEQKYNESPYGLKVMQKTGNDKDTRDNLVWQAGSLDWCSLNVYLGEDVQESLNEARKVINHWREKLCDQWDYRDLTTAWDGYPWCNSHYARQLIFWSIPLALSGQQYSAPEKTLIFAPKKGVPKKLPWFTPKANGTLEMLSDKYRLTVLSGRLQLKKLSIGKAKADIEDVLTLNSGQSVVLER